LKTNKYCSLFDKNCHADFLLDVHFVLLKLNQISTGCLLYRPAQRKLYGKFKRNVGVLVYCGEAWGLIHGLNASEFWVQRLHLMDTALNINKNPVYPAYPIE